MERSSLLARSGARRFYPQDQATDFIGFRCAMSRLGLNHPVNEKPETKIIVCFFLPPCNYLAC